MKDSSNYKVKYTYNFQKKNYVLKKKMLHLNRNVFISKNLNSFTKTAIFLGSFY